ncbi:MAG: biotin holocarboxylase synthetase [Alectoria sarmentosa]|nr:MAG: biotin holocarboxylase synthetase [Alectoria sarmentosa]
MNVLVYSGNGCTVEAVRHCVYSLRRLLSPNYAVISVDGNAIIKEPWTASCALLVFPGGADLGYCRTLNGEGNRRISQYVERGGSYMGFCAGAYYGSKRCEFEEGNKKLEVVGDRELAFYPGICRGLAFPGFVYHSEEGARAVELKVSKTGLTKGSLPDVFRSYYNGGGVFVDAPKFREKGVEILASYTQDLKVDPGKEIMAGLQEIVSIAVGEEYIKDENDTFHLEKPSAWSLGSLSKALTGETSEKTDDDGDDEDRIIDFNTVVKRLVVHEKEPPASKETPYFNHDAFYANLKHYESKTQEAKDGFGNNILYGEVVTSTNTMLEKNTEILRRLPAGFTATATVQVAGRGRGSNVWVSPAGSLMFSTVVRHPVSLTSHAPVVFLQYLAALAIVEGVKTYDVGYKDMQVKLKWPNDIYAVDPSSKNLVKIGGILVNSHYDSSEFLSVIGIGLNTTNAAPTTSLNALKPPSPFTLEKLLARILTTLSALYSKFVRTGFDKSFEQMYYKHWLHTDQIVTLEAEGGVRARIKGITRDWGLLIVEELGWEDRATGKIWTLQSDSNSFDFFKGLLKRKI